MASFKLFYTSYSSYLKCFIDLPASNYLFKKFSDGELYIKLEESVHNQDIWVIAATPPPAENLLELYFLLDALKRDGARVNLILTYYGYSRQDRAAPGEALNAEVVGRLLNSFQLTKVFIIHAHSNRLHDLLKFTNIMPLDELCAIAESYDAVAAPDKGAYAFTSHIADICHKERIFLAKVRPEHEQVKIIHTLGKVKSKNILIIDDIISTGNTLMAASSELIKLGAHSVSVYATHGVFAPEALNRLNNCPSLKKIYITNSLYYSFKNIAKTKLSVINIGPFIQKIIRDHS